MCANTKGYLESLLDRNVTGEERSKLLEHVYQCMECYREYTERKGVAEFLEEFSVLSTPTASRTRGNVKRVMARLRADGVPPGDDQRNPSSPILLRVPARTNEWVAASKPIDVRVYYPAIESSGTLQVIDAPGREQIEATFDIKCIYTKGEPASLMLFVRNAPDGDWLVTIKTKSHTKVAGAEVRGTSYQVIINLQTIGNSDEDRIRIAREILKGGMVLELEML